MYEPCLQMIGFWGNEPSVAPVLEFQSDMLTQLATATDLIIYYYSDYLRRPCICYLLWINDCP